jgi:RHS repeat-associated protein
MSSNFRLYYVLSFFRRAHSLKLMRYDYDLISGKVNEVQYQPGKPDAFYHRYHYDAENRLTAVQTSRDRVYWESDATYRYYAHGPLQRTVLGQQQVQGIDYAYTLQGWLKGVNSTSLQPDHDMGGDGRSSGGILSPVARDVAGFALHYHHGDYQPIGVAAAPFAAAASGLSELFNGNISAMSVHIGAFQPLHYRYRYDQLNRIKSLHSFTGLNLQGNHWNQAQLSGDYSEDVVYDPNGNIATYQRKGNAGLMDNLTYHYYYTNTQGQRSTYKLGNMPGDIRQLSNQLAQVTDLVTENVYSTDIDDQSQSDNYRYDPIGNLIADQREGISEIEWSVYGKIKKITKNNALITYGYDAAGNRIFKQINGEATTLYVRDASGNVMSVYEGANASSLKQAEVHLYGSSRLGIAGGAPQIPEFLTLAGDFTAAKVVEVKRGEKFFEWSNHLGNVLATVSDRKIAHSSNSSVIDYYTADVISAQDYYPFGMIMPGRISSSQNDYRYGFNGKENDAETKTQDYGMRISDPRLGRFLSVDPLTTKYPELTPYQFASNTPIQAVDLDGGEAKYVYGSFNTNSHPKLMQSEWFVINGQTNWASFIAASHYNTKTGNTGAYEYIYERSNYYKWANEVANSRGVNWFGAARDVTSESMVGAAEGINLWFMVSNTEKFMAGANKYLFEENMKNFGPWLLDAKNPITDGKNSFGHLSGAALDNQMVIIEQDKLQTYIDSYKSDFIKKNGQENWNEIAREINGLFGNSFLRTFTPEANKYSAQEFKKKYGEDAKFDFMSKEHRIFQGQKMAEFLRNQSENKDAKTTDE